VRFKLPSLPPRAVRMVQIVVAIGLLALLWQAADGPEAARILSRAEPLWLAAALAALSLQTLLSALRWRATASQLGIGLGKREALREYYLAQIVNQTLPGGMIGDAVRAVRTREQAGLLAASIAVVLERVAGQVFMFTVMASAFLLTLWLPGGIEWPRWAIAPVMTIIGVGLAVPPVLLLARRLPGKPGRSIRAFWRFVVTGLLARRVLPRIIMLSIGTTAANLAAFTFCAYAVGASISLVAALALVPLILFTMLIPISISGWGLREGAAATLLPLAGASASQGLAGSVAFGLCFMVAVLPGVLFVSARRTSARTQEASPDVLTASANASERSA
jgi:glycosyltransferase 2 family protein